MSMIKTAMIRFLILAFIAGGVALKPDWALKTALYFHIKTIELLDDMDWGCPAAFNKNACKEYDPDFYDTLDFKRR